MNRLKFVVKINYVLASLMMISAIALAQTDAQNDPAWETVRAVPYGEPLSITLKGGTIVEGTMIRASETNLRIYKTSTSRTSGITSEEIVELKKEDILNINRIEIRTSKKWFFIGAAAGAAVGAATGMALSNTGNCRPQSSPFGDVFDDVCGKAKTGYIVLGVLGGGMAGGFLGDRIGRGRVKRILIYKSK